ncbi:unnamed protein product [Arabidopsis thaliana]|uniref:Cullin N-terminal domain-containing protein n=1 Tax=Arabidopsis thaliana TaxID=3702 RepID=A0A5S9XRK1_ARATH|nr:unnamed protein product [Arabidopsis thaliana]
MKRSISPDPFSSTKSPKLVHHSPDDGGAEGNPYRLPFTLSDENLSCLPISQAREPPPIFNLDPNSVKDTQDRNKLYLAKAWDLLKPAIKIILDDDEYKKPGDVLCFTTIFRAVKRACLGDPRQSELVFNLVKHECEPHIAELIQSLENNCSGSDDPSVFLPHVYNRWLDFKRKMSLVSDVAMYQTLNGLTLWDVGQKLFHKQLSMAPQLQDQVITGILRLITDERLGKAANNTSDLLKNLMDMFRMQWQCTYVYKDPFLDSTSKFYAEEAEQVLQRSDISHYLKYVERTFLAEEEKCDKHYFFFSSSRSRLMKVLKSQLLEAHSSFLEEGFMLLMDESLIDDLRRMYRLFSMVDSEDYIDRILRAYILAKGEGARQEGSLQELHTSIDKIWHQCFGQDDLLDKTIRDCFEGFGLHVPGEFSDQLQWIDDDDDED